MRVRSLACLGLGTLLGGVLLAGCSGGGGGNTRLQEVQCDDGVDQDHDGLTDCDDPDCQGTAPCGGSGDRESDCNNGLDDDDDGSTDCDDRDCADTAVCTGGEVCDDGEDNDDDGDVDCSDPDCATSTFCAGEVEDCTNGLDDDDDGYIDCDDSECSNLPVCGGNDCTLNAQSLSVPTDTVDGTLAATDPPVAPRNSGSSSYYTDVYVFTPAAGDTVHFEITDAEFDTYFYLLDGTCALLESDDDGGSGVNSMLSYAFGSSGTYYLHVTSFSSGQTGAYTLVVSPGPTATSETDCSNGVDEDADGYTDCSDPDCEYSSDCVEPEDCADGLDNDQDGYADCADTDCSADANCAPLVCTTGACLCAEPVSIGFPNGLQSGVLAASDETGGPRGTSNNYDAYEFTATAGDIATFELIAGDFDTYLYLIGPTCTSLTSNDDGGTGLLSMISSYNFTTSGTYTIVVTQFSSGTGAYTLQITDQ